MGTVTVQGRDELGRLIDVQITTQADVAPPGPEVVAEGGGGGGITVDNQLDTPAEVTTIVAPAAEVSDGSVNIGRGFVVDQSGEVELVLSDNDLRVYTDDGGDPPAAESTQLTITNDVVKIEVGNDLDSSFQITPPGSTDRIFGVGWNNGNDVEVGKADSSVGFFGTSPIAKPTGVAVTAGGIHAALVSLGLIES